MANKTATFSGPRKSGSGNVVRGVPPPDPPYGPILAIYRPQKCRFGGPGPGARFGRGPEFPETFPGPPGPRKFSPPGGPPGTPLRGGPWGVRLGSRMGSGSGVPPDPGIGGLGPALGQGTPYRGPGIVHRGGDSIWGDTPQTPRVMPAAPGGTVPPGPPQGSGAAGPRSGSRSGTGTGPCNVRPGGTVAERSTPDDGGPV